MPWTLIPYLLLALPQHSAPWSLHWLFFLAEMLFLQIAT